MRYHFSNVVAETVVAEHVVDVDMHAITPVMMGIGWNIDALGTGIGELELVADGEPVLQREDAEHGT